MATGTTWLHSGRRFGKQLLRSLDDAAFRELCRFVRKRESKNSGSRKHAGIQVQKLHRRRDLRGRQIAVRRRQKWQMRQSILLTALCPERDRRWRVAGRTRKRLEIDLQNFSFLDNPAETTRALCRLAGAETQYENVRLNFCDEHMLDIGPYLVLGLMGQSMVPFVTGGKLPVTTRRAIEATDLTEFLDIIPLRMPGDGQRIVPFRLQRRGSVLQTDRNITANPSTKEKVTTELVQAVRVWLESSGAELTDDGEKALSSLCNEILENGERHARPGDGGDWAVAGLMERREQRGHSDPGTNADLVCNFAFVSIGLTIPETIFYTESPTVKSDLTRYCALHRSHALPDSVLATLFAAQDGMTRKRYPPATPGGLGLMSAVEAVAGLTDDAEGSHNSSLTIISGPACIQFKGQFLNVYNASDSDARRFQWLNVSQSPREAPNRDAAFALPVDFPGTIITARFVLRGDAVSRGDALGEQKRRSW